MVSGPLIGTAIGTAIGTVGAQHPTLRAHRA